jgi:competence protein ComEA
MKWRSRFIAGIVLALTTAPAVPLRRAAAATKDLDGVINLNTAGADLLELLPGIGPAKVRSIVWYRQRHPFRTVDELVRIKGIGRKMVRKLRPHLAVSGPTTAQAVRRAGAELAHSPRPVVTAPPRPTAPSKKPSVALAIARARGRPSAAVEHARTSSANHCAAAP